MRDILYKVNDDGKLSPATSFTTPFTWWRGLSINEQNALMDKHFPGWDRDLVIQNSRNIIEMHQKETA